MCADPSSSNEALAIPEPRALAYIEHHALDIGHRLGSGSFADVYKVKWENKSDTESLTESVSENQYAIKCLKPRTRSHELYAELAAKDLAEEAKILAKLPAHPHIIRLHGVSAGFWLDAAKGFLLLDHLTETLQGRIARWKMAERKRSVFQRRGRAKDQLQRICEVGVPLADALGFLHRHKICYRDIKPANIGYDEEGTIRLFDFGLAREHSEERRMTGLTGTIRYMAPEVMMSATSTFATDVYSFTILLWEVATLRKPFARVKSLEVAECFICARQGRPSLRAVLLKQLHPLFRSGWQADPASRPDFPTLISQIQEMKDFVGM